MLSLIHAAISFNNILSSETLVSKNCMYTHSYTHTDRNTWMYYTHKHLDVLNTHKHLDVLHTHKHLDALHT